MYAEKQSPHTIFRYDLYEFAYPIGLYVHVLYLKFCTLIAQYTQLCMRGDIIFTCISLIFT
jgi:hypothetical protein